MSETIDIFETTDFFALLILLLNDIFINRMLITETLKISNNFLLFDDAKI